MSRGIVHSNSTALMRTLRSVIPHAPPESGTLSTYPVLSGFSAMAFPAKAICNRTAASTAF